MGFKDLGLGVWRAGLRKRVAIDGGPLRLPLANPDHLGRFSRLKGPIRITMRVIIRV